MLSLNRQVLLTVLALFGCVGIVRADAQPAFVPLLSDADVWKRLPALTRGQQQPLPAWARALARSLPDTTAAMLELDFAHRMRSPLEPRLRGKMRWVAADANRSPTTAATAAGDLRRAGLGAGEFAELRGDWKTLPERERLALVFARKMTRAAYTVTDDEVAALVKEYGEKRVVAMVLLLAHANFQDRLVLSLGVSSDDAPLPLDVAFRREKEAKGGPPRPATATQVKASDAPIDDPEWKQFDFPALQKNLAAQRERPGRVRVPTWDEVARGLPPDPTRRPIRIKWSLVCMGYQPELATGWSGCTGAFRREAKQDRVFEESLFWVVTRTLQCFY